MRTNIHRRDGKTAPRRERLAMACREQVLVYPGPLRQGRSVSGSAFLTS